MLHAKQLGKPLGLAVKVLLDRGIVVVLPPRLVGEYEAVTLRAVLGQIGVAPQGVTRSTLKAARNKAKLKAWPGTQDQEAVTLAWIRGGVLLTHDQKCRDMADSLKVPTLDLLDLLAHGVRRGLLNEDELEAAMASLPGPPPFAWQPPDAPASPYRIMEVLEKRGARRAEKVDTALDGLAS